jgi:hypothetical protein
MKSKKAEAKRLWDELRESVSKRTSPFAGMTKEEVIKHLRKTRKNSGRKSLRLVLDANEYIFALGFFRKESCESLLKTLYFFLDKTYHKLFKYARIF